MWHKDKFIAAGQDGIIMFSGMEGHGRRKWKLLKVHNVTFYRWRQAIGAGKDGIIVVSGKRGELGKPD